MAEKMTRQQRRATERRADKPEPATVERTSLRHAGRTKGQPFSRMKLDEIIPAQLGKPAVFKVSGYTTNKSQMVKATFENIDWFVKGITADMKMTMLGRVGMAA